MQSFQRLIFSIKISRKTQETRHPSNEETYICEDIEYYSRFICMPINRVLLSTE